LNRSTGGGIVAKIRAVDVFTPSDFPALTYVARDDEKLEIRLRDALSTPGEIVSISGPSKSGKTVLVEKVVGRDSLITITGAGIRSPEDLWDRTLDWMETPDSKHTTTTLTGSGTGSVAARGEAGVPLVARGSVEGKMEGTLSASRASTETRGRHGLVQVVDEIGSSPFVLLIDDFHYMDRGIQTEVAKQIKEAARLGVKICTASVPHHSDDVVRSNPELRGRVRAVDLSYWSPSELAIIAGLGFPLLNVNINGESIRQFSSEASGSPQLMQALCLQACFELEVREKLTEMTTCALDDARIRQVMEETSTRTDFGSLVRNMHTGPKTRGTERREFDFSDGSRGDVYRCVLLAIAGPPPRLNFPYNELSRRIQKLCSGETPQAASIYQACSQMAKMALDMYPGQRVLEWDDDDILDVIDPYFLFFLRWSGKLANLKQSEGAP
jgi:hypothetical protein